MEEMKFRVYSPEHSKAIQEKLFELGYEWVTGEKSVQQVEEPMLLACNLFISSKIYVHNFDSFPAIETTLDDLYKMQVPTSVVLNGSYKALISENGRIIKVGCQSFTFDRIEELYKACKKQQK